MRVAILIPTCDAYARVASITSRRLDTLWHGHPPAFVCGLRQYDLFPDGGLPCVADPADWIGIVLDAAAHLGTQGFDWLYLVLDDHPPFGPCNADHLNRVLPERAEALGAMHVNLQGWDQFQSHEGEVLGRDCLYWQRNAPEFHWKFSLHPGFWHIATLVKVMRQLREQSSQVRTARAFEGAMEAASRAVDAQLSERTFRVCGDRFAAGRHWFERRGTRAVARRVLDAARFGARLGGQRLLTALDRGIKPYMDYINGPYPMFWSGLVRKGQLNGEALRFLRWSGQGALADEIRGNALQTTG